MTTASSSQRAVESTPAWRADILSVNTPRWNDGMLVIAEGPESPTPMAVWQSAGWSYTERLTQPTTDPVSRQWRWIEGRAEVGVMTSADAGVWLKVTARSFNRSRRLKMSLGSREISTFPVGEEHAEYQTPEFELPAGTHVLTLESLDAGESPSTGDPRMLSIAVFRIEFVATKR